MVTKQERGLRLKKIIYVSDNAILQEIQYIIQKEKYSTESNIHIYLLA